MSENRERYIQEKINEVDATGEKLWEIMNELHDHGEKEFCKDLMKIKIQIDDIILNAHIRY